MDEQKQFVTLADLCKEDATRDQAETFLPRYNAYIRHRTRVPLSMLLKAQSRFRMGQKRADSEGYFIYLLRYLLLNPRVETDEQARTLLHADGQVMMDIIGQAVNTDFEEDEDAADEAGESPGFV
ncbi:MAG: hypothetical protein M0R37_10645 [Bacteroidales bacterium]|nr:hypothetical protein [Bacteroidales bacterium]